MTRIVTRETLDQKGLDRALDLLQRGMGRRLDSMEQAKLANTISAIAALKVGGSGVLATLRVQSTAERHRGFCRRVVYTNTVTLQIPTGEVSAEELADVKKAALAAYEDKLNEEIAELLLEVEEVKARAAQDALSN